MMKHDILVNDVKEVAFFVGGIPRPGGSKTGFAFRRKNGKLGVNMVDAGGKRTKLWREAVTYDARKAMSDRSPEGLKTFLRPLSGPVALYVTFIMPRPKAHFLRGEVRENAPYWCTTKPDATKLLRSLEDSLTGVCWIDDSQVVWQVANKRYAGRNEPTGASVRVCVMKSTVQADRAKDEHHQAEAV